MKQLTATQAATVGRKSVVDAYGLWTVNPGLADYFDVSRPARYVKSLFLIVLMTSL